MLSTKDGPPRESAPSSDPWRACGGPSGPILASRNAPAGGWSVFLFVASEWHPVKTVDVDPAVARASTLPSSSYVDPTTLEQEKERIFGRTWQLVARADELAQGGDLKPAPIVVDPIL